MRADHSSCLWDARYFPWPIVAEVTESDVSRLLLLWPNEPEMCWLLVGKRAGLSASIDAIESAPPRRGRRRTSEGIQKRIDAIDAGLAGADALSRVRMVQERLDLAAELRAAYESAVDLAAVEDAFVAAVAEYSNRKGLSYAAWREVGVTAAVLKRAGITRNAP
jgi:hypothetical protein